MTLAKQIQPAPVRKSVTVEASVERAFEVFTRHFGTWWPASHAIGKSPLKTAVIEPRNGGRWYEVDEDGSECEWGEVLAWTPPTRVLLAWRISGNWEYDQELLTEVDVRFTPLSDSSTRVDLEHRLLENMGEAAERARQMFESDGGWSGLLAKFEAVFGTPTA